METIHQSRRFRFTCPNGCTVPTDWGAVLFLEDGLLPRPGRKE
jgi:hypothetical protein